MAPPFPAFQFYPSYRLCPQCRGRLLTTVPLKQQFMQGVLGRMGLTCHCVTCNHRYRAVSFLKVSLIAWAGPLGRWLWWQTASLEQTTPPEEST